MIDPTKITNYKQTRHQLEEVLIFWICVAGKTALQIAPRLDRLLKKWKPMAMGKNPTPFDIIKQINYRGNLAEELKSHGIGCYNQKARSLLCLIWAGLDLKKCTVEDLEKIPGIGPKTARCFLMHSRKDAEHAGLDTHVLKFMGDLGYEVPKGTPTGKRYRDLEKTFIMLARRVGMSVADFDLLIWNAYSGNKGKPEDVLEMFDIIPYRRKLA
jgi:hypothetical protein